jgi:hypothetical protein
MDRIGDHGRQFPLEIISTPLKIVTRIGAGASLARETGERSRPPGVAEYLFAELRQAFQDIRQKVVEEGWFGRVVTAAPVVDERPVAPEGEILNKDLDQTRRPSFEELWATRERSPEAAEQEHQRDMDFDR